MLNSASLLRFFSLSVKVISLDAGKTRGRNDRLRGQIGVRRSAGTVGWIIDPPDDNEYAVDPVGVLTSIPSATASVRNRPLTWIRI